MQKGASNVTTLKFATVQPTTLLALLLLTLTACSEDGDINIFSVEQDLELGRQTDAELRSMPQEFPIIERPDAPAAYDYLQGMVDDIVQQGNVPYADVFPYQVTLIDQEVQNAFATPGGFLYVYTGLIQTLESGDELAGVLGHEIAHAAERHSTDQLTQRYGVSTLIGLLTGSDPGLLTEIAGGLLSLTFSRSDEREADDRSVDYLCNTDYAANGAAAFFAAIQDQPTPPAFLSSHPNPGDRVAAINTRADEKGCSTEVDDVTAFERFRNSLP